MDCSGFSDFLVCSKLEALPLLSRDLIIEVAFKYCSFLRALLVLRLDVIEGELTEESSLCVRLEV